MEYREIVAVTGLGGLFQLVATKSDGAIVRNVADKAVKFISARTHNITPLESIEVYTISDNVRLHEVFLKMKENHDTIKPVDAKSADNNAIKAYFKSVFPDIDEDRVYTSDMKKMLKWYELLKENELLNFELQTEEEAPAAEAAPAKEEKVEEPAAEEKPKKKAAAKKKSAEPAAEGAEATEKPKKKAAPKKKATEE